METATLITLSPQELRRIIREEVTEAVKVLREDRMLSRREVEKLPGKSGQTIARMVERGMIEEYYTDHGSRPRYKFSEIMEIKDLK